jgi:prepilin-type N-terminal cleavage/methylation domain-containing protein
MKSNVIGKGVRRQVGGMTLVEVMVSVALGAVLLAMGSSLWLFGSRSFVAMSNYSDLGAKSRQALDLMSREIRSATRVTGFDNTGTAKWLAVTNDVQGTTVIYTWNAASRRLVRHEKRTQVSNPGPNATAGYSNSERGQVFLTECDRWDFDLFQRAPQKNGTYVFFPATNSAGAYDLSVCKLVNMTWKCSRTVLGSKSHTESVQTAQVVLRNKQ